jgi:hypothetical protein
MVASTGWIPAKVASTGWIPAKVASEKWIPWIPQKNPARQDRDLLTY